MSGRVLDVIVDLRIDSPTFSHHYALELDGAKGEGVYLPQGIAHGFYVLSESAAVSYAVTAEYSRDFDAGILWSSIDFVWPEDSPIVSERDSSFSRLAEFSSTFRLAGP